MISAIAGQKHRTKVLKSHQSCYARYNIKRNTYNSF